MFYDLDWNTNSYSKSLKAIWRTILTIIILLKSDKGFGSGKKNMSATFELARIRICISGQVIKHLEIGLNLENSVLSYSM